MRDQLIELELSDERSSEASSLQPAFIIAAPAPPLRTEFGSLQDLLVIFEDETRCDLPPDDVLSLLIASALFARAAMRLDGGEPSYRQERQCYDALATLKLTLRRVAWSRGLE